jgi:hypothetical protein
MMPLYKRPKAWCSGGLAVAFWAGLLATGAAAAPASPVPSDEAELMLLEVKLGQYVVQADLTSFRRGGSPARVMIPLGELSRSLGLAVDVSPAKGTASGFIIHENRPFRLDLGRGEATLQGVKLPFDRGLVELRDDDVYVEAGLLSKWLPVGLEVDPYEAQVKVRPREVLPLEERLAREGRALADGEAIAAYPRMDRQYRWLAWPTIDQQVGLAMRPVVGSPASPFRMAAQYASLLTGELLLMNSELFLAGNELSPLSDARLTLTRKDPSASLFGPLRATEVSIGQFSTPGLSLGGPVPLGLTMLVGNLPLTQPSQFDRHSFRGNMPPGWDVELYRGETLMGHQPARADGQYTFEDIPLLIGMNEFRLVFYGPQGQRREEFQRFNIGDAITPPGEHRYRVSSTVSPVGTTGTAQYDVGLFKQLSASLGATGALNGDPGLNVAQVGLRGYHQGIVANADLGLGAAGPLSRLGAQTSLGRFNLSGRYERAWSEPRLGVGGSAYRSRSLVRMDGLALETFGLTLGAAAEAGLDESFAQNHLGRFSLPLSLSAAGVSAINRLDWTLASPFTASDLAFRGGSLQLSTRWEDWGVRGEFAYDLQALRYLAFTATSRELPWEYLLSATVGYAPQSANVYAQLTLSKSLGVAFLGVDAGVQGMGVNLNSSVAMDPALGPWTPRANAQAASASVVAQAFLDLNRDGVRSAGEPPLPGVGIGASVGNAVATGPDGRVVLTGLPGYMDTDLNVLPDTLDDPLWAPRQPGVRVFPAPGQTLRVDFPIVAFGEVNGSVYLKRRGATNELAGVRLELLDAKDTVFRQVTSAYDGFYTFAQLPPGRYTLRIPPDQFTQGKPDGLITKEIVIAPAGTMLDGIDLTLEMPHAPDIQKIPHVPVKKKGPPAPGKKKLSHVPVAKKKK